MAISFDQAFGVHQYTMGVRNTRSEVLASNIANSDTPGYKAKDIDFSSALQQALGKTSERVIRLARTDDMHMKGSASIGGGDILYRVPEQPDTGDGNTVDVQTERMEFLDNAMRYQASLEFLNQRIQLLNRAIRGEQG
ncbi:MAG: flagellar basal body rod protein FlgB [Succinivibrionaceae bacterium]|nr:flagellar basal body rod protein FlgB [Succinivibrionaceae bacterium]